MHTQVCLTIRQLGIWAIHQWVEFVSISAHQHCSFHVAQRTQSGQRWSGQVIPVPGTCQSLQYLKYVLHWFVFALSSTGNSTSWYTLLLGMWKFFHRASLVLLLCQKLFKAHTQVKAWFSLPVQRIWLTADGGQRTCLHSAPRWRLWHRCYISARRSPGYSKDLCLLLSHINPYMWQLMKTSLRRLKKYGGKIRRVTT